MRSRLLAILLFAACLAPIAAQDGGLSTATYADYERGDGIFSLTLGTMAPLFFVTPDGATAANAYPGFEFALSYYGFLSEHWAIGGQLGGAFIGTLADRRLFIAPLSARVGYAINLNPFLIVPTAGVGMAVTALGEAKHIDPLFLAGSSFYWRINNDMSYGLGIFANVIPQLYKDSSQNTTGFFLEAALSVSYHL